MEAASHGDYDQSAARKAIDAFQDFLVRYPDSDKAAQAQDNIQHLGQKETQGAYNIAKFYETQHDTRAAFIYYNEVVREDPNSAQSQDAKKRIAELRPQVEAMPGGLAADGTPATPAVTGSTAPTPIPTSGPSTDALPPAPTDTSPPSPMDPGVAGNSGAAAASGAGTPTSSGVPTASATANVPGAGPASPAPPGPSPTDATPLPQ
jgi:outer membrane protein assembly factor BamD